MPGPISGPPTIRVRSLPAETQTGNANLFAFVLARAFDNGKPRRYEDIRRLNDGLRRRGRDALLAYLCHDNRVALPWQAGLYATVPRELSDLLLLDVQAGFARARQPDRGRDQRGAGVHPPRSSGPGAGLDGQPRLRLDVGPRIRHLRSLAGVQAARYLQGELDGVGGTWQGQAGAAFRFLEDGLKGAALTCAVPGGLEWWPDEAVPAHDGLQIVQAREPATLRAIDGARCTARRGPRPDRHAGARRTTLLAGRDARRLRHPLPSRLAAARRRSCRCGCRRRSASARASCVSPPPACLSPPRRSPRMTATGRAV